ncbi:MAG: hypothetical protein JWN44_6521 [Myxococcales bacterium]|nr:hypothetical protein [Myxococcales bacterium]
MQLYVLALILDVVSAPTCVTRGSQIACGYKCSSNLNQLACAQTPEGMCAATTNEVVCWDPPPDVRQLLQSGRDDLPQPSCITSLGHAACGFYCVRSGNQVACANSPMGACATRFGVVRCWDPAPEVRWAMAGQEHWLQASCERTLDKVVCGYHCVSTADDIRCASTPWGMCDRHFDRLACWDPPTTVQSASTLDLR